MSERLVLDASAALRIVLGLENADTLLEHVESASVVSAPDLHACEVANALWKYVIAGEIEAREAVGRFDSALHLIDDLGARGRARRPSVDGRDRLEAAGPREDVPGSCAATRFDARDPRPAAA